jgi:hypothetical protein
MGSDVDGPEMRFIACRMRRTVPLTRSLRHGDHNGGQAGKGRRPTGRMAFRLSFRRFLPSTALRLPKGGSAAALLYKEPLPSLDANGIISTSM